jgi:hypothetical protein
MINRIFEEEGVPTDLAYMAHQESAFKTSAYSRAKAKGLWQFMAPTGRKYGLKRDQWVDERSDPEKSTRAAARYLRDLYGMFGDWYLAMAAYNCGQGCVDAAIQRTGYADFWELRRLRMLPLQTANYVPAILAMTILFANRDAYGLEVEFNDPVHFESRELQSETSITLIAQALDRPLSELKDLNPALVIASGETVELTSPYSGTISFAVIKKGMVGLGGRTRRAGSAALDLAYVACGRLDAFWEFGLKPWDMAAGTLIVREAGGAVSDMKGAPHNVNTSENLLADNGTLHEPVLGLFDEIFRGHFRVPIPQILAG